MPRPERVFVDTATLYPVSLADLVLRLAELGSHGRTSRRRVAATRMRFSRSCFAAIHGRWQVPSTRWARHCGTRSPAGRFSIGPPPRDCQGSSRAWPRCRDPIYGRATGPGWQRVRQYAWGRYRDPDVVDLDPALLVGRDQDGVCAVVAHHRFEEASRYLMVVVMHPDARGKGNGTSLWKSAVASATLNGHVAAFWSVHHGNAHALALSRDLGYIDEGPTDDGYLVFRTD